MPGNSELEKDLKKKHVGFLIMNIANGGGTERVTTIIANKLSASGYRISIISCREGEKSRFPLDDSIHLYSLKGEVISNGIIRKLAGVKRLKVIVEKYKIDVMVAVDIALYAYLWPLQIRKACRCIAWEHFNYYISLDFMAKIGRELAVRYSDYIVVLGKSDLKNYRNHYKKIKNITYIYNPLSVNKDDTTDVKQKNIVSVGRLEEQKGFDLLIRIWEKVEPQNKEWILNIYGEGSCKQKLQSMISERGLKNIYLCGYAENIEKVYLKSSIFALSSRYEGYVLVLLEAQAKGLPCISFDCKEGPREIIEDGVNGFLVQEGNLDEYAEKLLNMMDDLELREKMSKYAKKNLNKYDINNIIRKWEKVLAQL